MDSSRRNKKSSNKPEVEEAPEKDTSDDEVFEEETHAAEEDQEKNDEETKKKRRTRGRDIDVSALSSRPSIKKFVKQEGKKCQFVAGTKSKSGVKKSGVACVCRTSASALNALEIMANDNNKKTRKVVGIAVRIAAVARKKTVSEEHVKEAEEIYISCLKD